MVFNMVDVYGHRMLINKDKQAQADTCRLGLGMGECMQSLWWWGGEVQGRFHFLPVQSKMGWNQYHDKLTLNSSTSSSCKQEVWRSKRDLETSSGVGGGQDYVDVMPQHNKREMTGDEGNTTHDISP